MNYQIALFLHLAGAVATFVGVGAWFLAALAVRQVRRVEEVRSLASICEMGAGLALVGIVAVAASGLGMALTVWGLRNPRRRHSALHYLSPAEYERRWRGASAA